MSSRIHRRTVPPELRRQMRQSSLTLQQTVQTETLGQLRPPLNGDSKQGAQKNADSPAVLHAQTFFLFPLHPLQLC